MFNISELNASQLDFFQELENIGASHAATALSNMLGQPISLQVSKAQFCEFNNICDILSGPETLVVALLVEMTGELNGYILLVLKADDARDLSISVIKAMGIADEQSDTFLTELQQSAILEVANILSGSYMTAMSRLTDLSVNCAVPKMVIDMAGAVMNLPMSTYGEFGDLVLFLETEFHDLDKCISGHFF